MIIDKWLVILSVVVTVGLVATLVTLLNMFTQ